MKKPTRILLVRHGETDANRKGIAQGHIDGELNASGRKQARAVAKRLSKTKIDAIYVSTLKRAAETAKEIARYHECRIIHSKLLWERDYGKFNGVHYKDFDQSYRRNPFKKPPKGESISDALNRAKPEIEKILRKEKGKTVLIVTHGILGRVIICHLLGVPLANSNPFTLQNAAITEIDLGERVKLVRFNDHAHFED